MPFCQNLRALFLFVTLCLTSGLSFAQPTQNQLTESQLALQYYRQADYSKAADIFARLFQQNPSETNYTYYLDCLLQLSDYDNAEALINSQIKLDKTRLKYNVDLGHLYDLRGRNDKAKQIFTQAIKKMPANINQVFQLANAFIGYRLFEFAEQTYLDGQKLMKGTYGFHLELAHIYYYQRNFERMIEEYLNILKTSDVYLQQVQNNLQQAVYSDTDNNLNSLLTSKLLEYIREYPDNNVFSELLIWIYCQDKKFRSALMQAKALDRRLQENGRRVIELARMASDNNDFQTAIEAYQYVIGKGGNQEYTFEARSEMLQVMFRRIELGIDSQISDYERLEQAVTDALQDLGVNAETIDLVRILARLKSAYLGKTADAQFLLEDARTIRLDKQTLAKIDIELADVYLMQGNDADATLAYAQVEDNNKNNPIGSEARLRKARLAYYIGNFMWAQAQLDALKASVEKLTANDAAYLSLLIEDNYGWDNASDTAMLIYSKADLLHYQHQDSLALQCLDSIISFYHDAPIVDEAWYLKAEIFRSANKIDKAVEAYSVVATQYADDVLADNATYMLASIYSNQLNDKQSAMEQYLKIITDYASSIFVIEARKNYRLLRGDKLSD